MARRGDPRRSGGESGARTGPGSRRPFAAASQVLAREDTMTPVVRDRRRIAMIGLGEAGGLLAQGLVASGMFHVAGYDALLKDPATAPAVRSKISSIGITECSS